MTWVYLALFVGFGGWLSAIDVRTHTLPNRIVYPATVTSTSLALFHSLFGWDPSPLIRHVAGAALMFGVFYCIAWVSRGALGGGDVKFAAFLGGLVSVLSSPWWVFVAAAASFVIGGMVSLGVMFIGRQSAETKIAFGPSMFVATACVLFWAIG